MLYVANKVMMATVAKELSTSIITIIVFPTCLSKFLYIIANYFQRIIYIFVQSSGSHLFQFISMKINLQDLKLAELSLMVLSRTLQHLIFRSLLLKSIALMGNLNFEVMQVNMDIVKKKNMFLNIENIKNSPVWQLNLNSSMHGVPLNGNNIVKQNV